MTDKPVARRIVELREKGLSFAEIGLLLDMHKQQAHQVYKRVLAEQGEQAT